MPPVGSRSTRSIWPWIVNGGDPSSGSIVRSKSSSSCSAVPIPASSPVQKLSSSVADPPGVALLGDLVAEFAGRPLRLEEALEVLPRGRRLAAGQPSAPLLREVLERGVGARPERERGHGPARRDPVDVVERVLGWAFLVLAELGVAEGARQRQDIEEVRAGAVVERDRAERERVEPAGAGGVGIERDRRGNVAKLGGDGHPGVRRLGIAIGRPLDQAQQLDRLEPQREARLAGARDGHRPAEGERAGRAPPRRARRRARRRPGPIDRRDLLPRPGEQLVDEDRRRPSSPPARRCVVTTSRSWARVSATYRSRRSSSVWMSPAGIASRRRSFGKRPLPYSRAGHSSRRSCGTKTTGNSRPFAWYSVISRTPSTSSVSSTLVGKVAAGALVRVEVVDEAGEGPLRVLLLPVGGEAQEAREVRDHPLRLEGIDRDEVEDQSGPLDEPLEHRQRAFAPGHRGQLVEGLEEAAELRPGQRGDVDALRVPRFAGAPRS